MFYLKRIMQTVELETTKWISRRFSLFLLNKYEKSINRIGQTIKKKYD